MAVEGEAPRAGRVIFTGSRWELTAILMRGFLLMIPTVGIYRFWQTTFRRHFYWEHTLIAGEPLEYTGTALQLLIGFLFALALFLPVYIGFFFLSTQPSSMLLIGYGVFFTLVWFLSGYAIYRARDFRLSRTLWRGIRFDQKGSAWGYAFRRMGWSLLMIVTLGLVYPFMAANLWRYRYNHTWFGDRRFALTAGARRLAGPFYALYMLNAAVLIAFAVFVTLARQSPTPSQTTIAVTLGIAAAILLLISFAHFHCLSTSRMLSSVSIGESSLTVNVNSWSLIGQYVVTGLALLAAVLVFGIVLFGTIVVVAMIAATHGAKFNPDEFAGLLTGSPFSAFAGIALYLLLFTAYAVLTEILLGIGWWVLLARGTTINNVDALSTVNSGGEDRRLIGEGLADALNVGAY